MAWVAVDENGTECIYQFRPIRTKIEENKFVARYKYSMWLALPKGSIEKLIGRKLTWKDDPVELKEE